ncbi:MAG: hypothetical protein H7Z16_16560 [Pyrinomonadaceae bacterium]|nr:hypothetical protein [Pyrinomonadaceae bacterium]
MSYLDLPRLHFSGLFFTNPNTINNVTQNYTPGISFENPPPAPPDQYNMNAGPDPGDSGWNPLGVAQWWLEECTVLSAVGTEGVEVDASDAVIGALVESPSPKTPMSDGQGGFYDIAKMVDLDPDQQGRSALYGLRIAVTLPNGAGLQGLMTVPEIRQMGARIAIAQSSWGAVCNWMGTLQDVQWSGDISGSPLLIALQAASAQGLAVKLTVDLHQNNPGNNFTSGDMFFYGRVLGSIGPALSGELAQVLPGRCLQKVTPATTAAALERAMPTSNRVLQGRDRVVAQTMALGALRDSLTTEVAAAAAPEPWNPAFAIVRQANAQDLLSIDIGGCILLNATQDPDNPSGLASDGKFEVDSGIVVGVFNLATKKFVAFANGDISIGPQYQQLSSTPKNCMLVKNSCVFTILLTGSDGDSYKTNPLAIQVNGTTVAQEYGSGYWIDFSVSSQRLECGNGQTGQSQIMVRKFGNAVVDETPPVTSSVQLIDWSQGGNFSPSTDVGISFGKTDANGVADITTTVNVTDITLPPTRQPLGSQIYYILMSDSNQQPVGDGGPPQNPPGLSLLLWSAFEAPANPSWSDISPTFTAYARLYPGMKSRLDISDEATVVAFAPVVHAMMSGDISDPSYMPVTRDLSPSMMAMILSWLKQVSQK